MSRDPYSHFEYFSGFVPSGIIFQMQANEIARIAASNSDQLSTVNSLCLIGLVSYFEAFAKDHIASAISLAPGIISALRRAGYPTDLQAEDAYEFRECLEHKIGFLLSERFDLGSAKKINGIFTAGLELTPFSKNEAKVYDKILRDRNLIVHHGGTYTTAYIRQAFEEIPVDRRRAHADSLQVASDRILSDAQFLKGIVGKLIEASAARIEEILSQRQVELSQSILEALEAMTWWDSESEENPSAQNGEMLSADDSIRF